ncbi:Pentatricopeptide repeat-containing protein [Nymphaea thermarum]|nr:Pentatricopeptide repeat-containing protein [Nymphaea thermarum]
MPEKNVVTWTSLVTGYAQNGLSEEVLMTIREMLQVGVRPNQLTYSSALSSYTTAGGLPHGRQVHCQNGLVSMYGKCGLLEDSERVFYRLRETDLISWNSLMAGYAQHGHGRKAVELFEQMRHLGIRPDDTTFLCVLSACSHSGLHDKGMEYFDLMSSEQVVPKAEHYSCVVHLLGRAGYLDEAESFMNSVPVKPGLSMFRSLISACQAYGYKSMAIRVAKHFLELYPADSSSYVLLSNMFAGEGSWGTAAVVRKRSDKEAWLQLDRCWPVAKAIVPAHAKRWIGSQQFTRIQLQKHKTVSPAKLEFHLKVETQNGVGRRAEGRKGQSGEGCKAQQVQRRQQPAGRRRGGRQNRRSARISPARSVPPDWRWRTPGHASKLEGKPPTVLIAV